MKLRLVVEVPLVEDECYFPNIENDRREVERALPATMVVKEAEYVKEEADIKSFFKKLLRFKVEGAPVRGFKSSGYYSKGDEEAPFYSEAYLYNLLGKDDARSVLGYLRSLMETVGLDPTAVEREVNAEIAAEQEADKRRLERAEARIKFREDFIRSKGWVRIKGTFSGLQPEQDSELRAAMRAAGV